jgi:glyoxylase-like metal-dependent hydrolase (beta-lactamase superfamily II)
VEDIVGMVRLNFKRRIEFYDGDTELAPGLTLHLAPGHTAGLQVVRVRTQRGQVVLASDGTHFYENIEKNRPFIAAVKIERLADSHRHIVPGHDPLVMRRYAPPSPALRDVVVRLDTEPAE